MAWDVPIASSATRTSAWDGAESPWVVAAFAAAPWPVWSLVAALGTPGSSVGSRWLHGVLPLALVFALMVVWTHRPSARGVLTLWLPSILGTALMGELLASAIGAGRISLLELGDAGRALAIWSVCVAVYEVTPIVAAASRVSPREHRDRGLDLGAHALFLLTAAAAYAWAPWSASGWYVSPWAAAVIAFPLATFRCGPPPAARLPAPRGGWVLGCALMLWVALGATLLADGPRFVEHAQGTWRWGTDPLTGLLWAFAALSSTLSLAAASTLLVRALQVRRAPGGVVTTIGDGCFSIERPELDSPTWVELEDGLIPPEGSTVTLLSARVRGADAGPFRDGAPQLAARRAWIGSPTELARGLGHRAVAWLAWAAATALGLLLIAR